MILVCGATGDLGGRIVHRLLGRGQRVRALVRPTTDAGTLERSGAEVVRGDLRDPASLDRATAGVDTVVTTANAIGRVLEGGTDLTIADVDRTGNENLVRAAERAGVRRFVLVSMAGVEGMAQVAPYAAAKLATEQLLEHAPMEVVIVRPDMFQELWAGKEGGIDATAGRAVLYGRGRTPHRLVAVDDVAALTTHLALAPDPPRVVEFGGPEALTQRDVVAAWEAATGRSFTVRRVPRPVLAVMRRVLARFRPGLASVMGMALYGDRHTLAGDDRPLREAGIEPRSVTTFVQEAAAATRR